MNAERRSTDLILLVLVGAVVGMVVLVGLMLLVDYRPTSSSEGGFDWHPPGSAGWFRMLLGVLAGTGAALAIRFRRRPGALAAAVIGTIAALGASLLSSLVMWEQLALSAVNRGHRREGVVVAPKQR